MLMLQPATYRCRQGHVIPGFFACSAVRLGKDSGFFIPGPILSGAVFLGYFSINPGCRHFSVPALFPSFSAIIFRNYRFLVSFLIFHLHSSRSIAPNSCSLAAVSANINIFSPHQHLFAKSFILIIMPYFFKRLSF